MTSVIMAVLLGAFLGYGVAPKVLSKLFMPKLTQEQLETDRKMMQIIEEIELQIEREQNSKSQDK